VRMWQRFCGSVAEDLQRRKARRPTVAPCQRNGRGEEEAKEKSG